MDWIQFGVQWLHVILAIFWFGGTMFFGFIVIPTVAALPPATSREVGLRLTPRMLAAMRLAGSGVIVLGILRGTVWGPLSPGGDLSFASSYGITWGAAIVLAIAIVAVGDGVIGRTARRLYEDDALWRPGPDGRPQPAFLALVTRLRAGSLVALALFVAAFTCMILMRFGL